MTAWLLVIVLCCDRQGHLDHIRSDERMTFERCAAERDRRNAAWREAGASKVLAYCEAADPVQN